jgi:hypothetical protein
VRAGVKQFCFFPLHRFRHQRFCKTECQQEHFRDSEAWKERRREWMRDYYRKTHKSIR